MTKRLTALVLVLMMVFSLTVFAEENEKMKEVLSLVKERIPDTDSFEKFEGRENIRSGKKSYYFVWSNSGEDYKEISLHVTESGIITSYNYYAEERYEENPSINKPETKDFLKKAKELSGIINPSIKDKVEVNTRDGYESLYDREYYFTLTHKENGIPVYGDTGSLTIASDGETLLNYHMNYTEGVPYANPEKAIDKETAEKAYAKEIGMNLAYRTEYGDRKRTAYLSYIPEKTYGTYIDAFTGKAIEPGDETVDEYGSVTEESAAEDKAAGSINSSNRFSEAELKEFAKLENLISKEDAEKKIRNLNILKDKKAVLENISTNRDYYDEDRYYYSLTFEGEDYYYASAKIDAVTGKVLNFYQDTDYKELTEDDKDKTDEKINYYLSVLCPGETGKELEFRENEIRGRIGFKYFNRYINNIPYYDDGIRIEVGKDGYLASYSYSRTDMEFPDPEGIISEDDAAEKMFDLTEYELHYYKVSDKNGKPKGSFLLYMLTESVEIDAFTGERKLDYEVFSIPEYTDIKGHYAENAINALKRFGIGFAEKEFRPDDIITQKDYIAFLSNAVRRRTSIIVAKEYDAEDYYNSAYNYNIITKEERDDNAEVKRIDAAVYFIKALELAEIASLPGIYNCPFTDVTEKEGYVSILSGFGVVKGDGTGLFNPDRGVTRGEAAVMIYNYLAR